MPAPELIITGGINVPPYAQRGIVQTLAPIPASSQMRRTVNGALRDVSDPLFQKFLSQITVSDQQVPDFIFPGATVVVYCVAELSYLTSGGTPLRTPVEYSEREDGDYTFYRPVLTMKVVDWSFNHDEYQRVIGWTLNLEEV